MWKPIHNQIFFPLRRRFPKLKRRPYVEKLEPRLEAEIEQDFLPQHLARQMTEISLRDCLFYAWCLKEFGFELPRDARRILDIGSKNFFYAPALYYHFKRNSPKIQVIGLEADIHRLYVNFYRRADYAQYFVGLVNREVGEERVAYREGNWLDEPETETFDLITSFFPFLFKSLHDSWGLPRKFFKPLSYYRKACRQSKFLMVWNQGDAEKAATLELFKEIPNSKLIQQREFQKNPFVQRKHKVHILLFENGD